jgi:hypothetical protein
MSWSEDRPHRVHLAERAHRVWSLRRTSAAGLKPAYTLLLAGTVIPGLVAAAEVSLVGVAFAQRVGRAAEGKLFGWQFQLFLAALVFLVLVGCAYLIARTWTGAARLAGEARAERRGAARRGFAAGSGCWGLAGRYLLGVLGLCLAAGLVCDLLPGYRVPLAILVSAGPLGLLSPLILTAARSADRRGDRSGAVRPTDPVTAGDLGIVVLVVVVLQVLVGLVLAPLVLSAGFWLAVAGVLAAFVLSVPSTMFIAVIGESYYRQPDGVPR